jgi:hypothetical protein
VRRRHSRNLQQEMIRAAFPVAQRGCQAQTPLNAQNSHLGRGWTAHGRHTRHDSNGNQRHFLDPPLAPPAVPPAVPPDAAAAAAAASFFATFSCSAFISLQAPQQFRQPPRCSVQAWNVAGPFPVNLCETRTALVAQPDHHLILSFWVLLRRGQRRGRGPSHVGSLLSFWALTKVVGFPHGPWPRRRCRAV